MPGDPTVSQRLRLHLEDERDVGEALEGQGLMLVCARSVSLSAPSRTLRGDCRQALRSPGRERVRWGGLRTRGRLTG